MGGMNEAAELRRQLAADAKTLNLVEFWKERADIELTQPRQRAVPYRWRWQDIEPRLRVAASSVPIEECERRALVFANPGLAGKPYITHTLFAAYSLYNPAERAPVHRHTPSASRFVLQGGGGFTTVANEKLPMERGDLIITPNGTWHDHGNDGTEPVIWVDVLNVPLVESLNATQFEFGYTEPDGKGGRISPSTQSVCYPVGHSQNLYAMGGLRPQLADERRGHRQHSQMFSYKWEQTARLLDRLGDYDGDPYEAISVEFVDPDSGGPVMPTMSFRCQMLRPAESTLPQRKTASAMFVVLEGEGCTQVGDVCLEWKENDVFVVPSWAWYHHQNTGHGRAVLYTVNDEPVMRKLDLFMRERQSASGDVAREG